MKLITLFESIVIKNVNRASTQFKTILTKMIHSSSTLELYDENGFYPPDQVYIEFGKTGLPSEKNTVFVGNKYYDKLKQYSKLKNKVNTLKTFTDAIEVNINRMIAKRKTGHKQQGQLINKLPANPEDYIFQHLVEIQAEFRVITYYMNGKYQVSGIYKKTGANVSLSQISPDSGMGKVIADTAIKATKTLGYAMGGADIAIVDAKHLNDLVLGESVIGKLSSSATKMIGKINNLDKLLNDSHVIVLEVNSYPSMSNKAISYDLLKSISSVSTT